MQVQGSLGTRGANLMVMDPLISTRGSIGPLGSNTLVIGPASDIITHAGSLGIRGSNTMTKQLQGIDDLLLAIIERDQYGVPVTLIEVLRLYNSVLMGKTDGATFFKALDGIRTRIMGTSNPAGERGVADLTDKTE